MKKFFVPTVTAAFLGMACCVPLAQADGTQENPDAIQQLRLEIERMRAEYESRISDLEQRLDKAQAAVDPAAAPPPPAPAAAPYSGMAQSSASAFNPSIGVIFQGLAWSYSQDPENYVIPGFPLGGEAGLAPEGLSLAETEIDISANVDDKFTAWLTVPLVIEDGETAIEIEEAWIETLKLPAGLSVRMGRFFSNIGYLNQKHSHAWDFADQPLAYQAFLGSQYLDDGLQLRWLAPTDWYLELGAEVMRGDRYPFVGSARSGVGSHSLSVRSGGDIGISHSWQAGFSWLRGQSDARASGPEDEPVLFNGDTDLYVADFVWKWAPNGNSRQRNFKLQGEYLWRSEDGVYELPTQLHLPWSHNERGWYLQAVYQPFPRWRLGIRMDGLAGGDIEPEVIATPLYPGERDPRRYSLMVDWSNSEFSRLRFQFNRDEASGNADNQFGLQYIFSIGAHGAHSF